MSDKNETDVDLVKWLKDTITTATTTTMEEAGCLDQFNKVQECMAKNELWYQDKKCDSLAKEFRKCFYNSVKK